MFFEFSDFQFLARLSLAVGLGSIVGLERQWRQSMAGLRTNALVAAGAASYVMLSHDVPNGGDETHVLAYVVSGMGFLGAGVIMKEGATVRGLNTAATLWCSAAIGSASAFGFGVKASMLTLVVLSANTILRPVAKGVNQRSLVRGRAVEPAA